KKVVLFDFHNTLVSCDAWLDLEIRTLPGAVLRKLGEEALVGELPTGAGEEVTQLFRRLRRSVHESGREVSAAEGTATVLRQMGVDVPIEEIERAVERLEYDLLPTVEMIEGADHALGRLRDAGCRL